MKKFLSVFAMALVALATMAGELTVFDGTATSDKIPINATFMDWGPYTHQVIYPEAELTALVGQNITSVTYYVQNEAGCTLNGGKVSLSIGMTENAAFTDYSPSFISEGLTKVAEMAMTVGVQEIVFTFDDPWKYEGGNIVIQTVIEEDGSVSGSTATYFFGKNTGADCSLIGKMTLSKSDFAPKTTFTYDGGGEEPGITLLSEANALEDAAEFTFNGDAVVTICWKGSIYLRDASGYGQIVDGSTFENGQVLSQGWSATKTSDDGWVKYIDAANLSASDETNAELAAPQVLSNVPDETMLNAYVVAVNVHKGFTPIRSITLSDGTINLTGTGNQPASGDYNIYGIIWKVDGTLKFEPVKWEKYVEPEPEWQLGDVNHDHYVNVTDVTALIKYILTSGEEPEEFYDEQANVDGEGQINVADVTALIQMILSN